MNSWRGPTGTQTRNQRDRVGGARGARRRLVRGSSASPTEAQGSEAQAEAEGAGPWAKVIDRLRAEATKMVVNKPDNSDALALAAAKWWRRWLQEDLDWVTLCRPVEFVEAPGPNGSVTRAWWPPHRVVMPWQLDVFEARLVDEIRDELRVDGYVVSHVIAGTKCRCLHAALLAARIIGSDDTVEGVFRERRGLTFGSLETVESLEEGVREAGPL
jgi:hypothetical protein